MLRKYPAVFLLPFIILGIVTADLFRPESEWLLASCLASCLSGLLILRRKPTIAMFLLAVSLALFASFRFAARVYDHGPGSLGDQFEPGERYTVYGRVADWPVVKNARTEITLSVDSLTRAGLTVACRGGLLLRVTDQTTALQRNDRVVFSTRLYQPRGGESLSGFDYRRFLQLRGIDAIAYMDNLLALEVNRSPRSRLFYAVNQVRGSILSTFQRRLSPNAAALASGFLIGETRDVPLDVYQMFRDSGTLHLLAVSGSNVALIVLFVIVLLRPLHPPRQIRAVLLWGTILFFCWLSYAEPSVIRASLMASLVILAQVLQRRYDLNNVIAVTALIILLVEPAQLYSVGFQLSFVTAWGLILVLSDLQMSSRGIMRHRWVRWWLFLLLATLTAQLFSAPLSAFYFERIPLISPLANLLIVPAVSLSVLGSVLLLLMEALLPWIVGWVGWALDWLLRLIILMLQWFGGDHVPVWRLAQPSVITIFGCYGVLVLTALSVRLKKLRRPVVIVSAGLLNVWLAVGVIQNLGLEDYQYLDAMTVPGGVAILVRGNGSETADLFVSSAVSRSYSLSGSVLDPQLQAAGVRRLRYLGIADADFGALTDLLSTAIKFKADTVFLPTFLEASSTDILRRADQNRSIPSVQLFDRDKTESVGPGIAVEGGFRLPFPQTTVILSPDVPLRDVQLAANRSLCVITNRLRARDVEALSGCIDLIICSRVEQPVQPTPDRPKLLDLSQLGTVRIILPGDSAQGVIVKPDRSDSY